MALNAPVSVDEPASAHVVRRRLPGPDVVRAVALIGVVVMNFHGYLVIAADRSSDASRVGDGWAARLFDPWSGPLSTRFAATFVLVAGVGVTLLTRSVAADRQRVTEMRWRLVRRGLLLYTVGLVLDIIWPGTIIPYYGAMFVGAAALFTLRTVWIATIGVLAAVAGAGLNGWIAWRHEDGRPAAWLTDPAPNSVRRYVFDVFVNGTHPLLPWFAFLCAGIVLGRLFSRDGGDRPPSAPASRCSPSPPWPGRSRPARCRAHCCRRPHADGSLVYVASALGTALVAYAAVDWLAERFPGPTDPLRRAGQLTLSLYLCHVFVFNVVVDWLGWIQPAGLDVALVFALGFWVVAIAAAAWWQRAFGIGPAERFYRAFGG